MAYRVLKHFIDLQDGNHSYDVGDTFPRDGIKVLASRYKELASNKNRRGEPLIEEIIEDKPKKTKDEESEE